MKNYLNRVSMLAAAAAVCLLGPSAFADNFMVSYEAPGVQAPTGSTPYTTFGTSTTGYGSQTYVAPGVGTFNGSFELSSADGYGGAGGSGVYARVLNGDSLTFTPSGTTNYFGLWFSAADYGNTLKFYDGATLVETFTVADFSAAVGSCNSPNPYCGNPNNGGDGGEQFSYINFLDTTGDITSVVFSENAIPGYGFEFDNVSSGVANSIGGTPLGGTPEPSSLILLGSGMGALAAGIRRRIR